MLKMNKKGFTLVELLVVLAILGLLAGIGIPQYMKTLERSRQAADAAVVAMVQSAVDGFLAETGAQVSVIRSGDKLKSQAASGTLADSLLTGMGLNVTDFLQNGIPAGTAFKSMTVTTGDWYITANGKVYVAVGSGTDFKTIPSPPPEGAITTIP